MLQKFLLLSFMIGFAVPAFADDMAAMPGMAVPGDNSASSRQFAAANAKMHKAMNIPLTGDTDADFVKGMIAHHQGAIDMAKIELKYGHDEAIKSMATNIIAAQTAEIATMKSWLAEHKQ